jgi:hypothetical protein
MTRYLERSEARFRWSLWERAHCPALGSINVIWIHRGWFLTREIAHTRRNLAVAERRADILTRDWAVAAPSRIPGLNTPVLGIFMELGGGEAKVVDRTFLTNLQKPWRYMTRQAQIWGYPPDYEWFFHGEERIDG